MSLLLLKFFILLSVTWARGHQNIGMYLILKLPLLSLPPKNYVHTKSTKNTDELKIELALTRVSKFVLEKILNTTMTTKITKSHTE